MRWTAKDIQRLQHGTVSNIPAPKKKHKYSATRVVVNGIKFPSIKEGEDYKKLLLLERSGYMKDLRLQVKFELNPGGTFSYVYRADFTYTVCETGEQVVADSKGCKTREYLKKRALMLKVHGVTIKEL